MRPQNNQKPHYRESDSWDSGQSSFTFHNHGNFGKGPKGWKRSDEKIKDEVCELLFRDPYIDARNIEVAVKEGTVVLTGSVDSRSIKRHSEEIIEHLTGVHDVQNELRVVKKETPATKLAGLGH